MQHPVRRLHRAMLRAGYRWLYGPGAATYELVARAVSLGEWDSWRHAALDQVSDGPVLELGFGTGRLIPDLLLRGPYTGLDPSPHMHAQARRFVRRRGLHDGPTLVRGRAEQLPFAAGSFASVVATFPTAYILDAEVQAEIARVLVPGGRLVIVSEAALRPTRWPRRLAGRLLSLSNTGPRVSLGERLRAAGFAVTDVEVQYASSVSRIWIGSRPAG